MFRKVLIANRGEIAVRIAQACQELGARAVAVFSEADRRSPHVLAADEAYALEGLTPGETYLDMRKILAAAQQHDVDAIHPGYGFLSENAAFARACAHAGLTFIGPAPDVIARMGDKVVAKQTMTAAGVPVVPGWSGEEAADGASDEPGASPAAPPRLAALRRAADDIGYPVLLKAAAGGGGKGMRIVRDSTQLQPALEAAQREANSAFGDGRVFLEKYIERPRHIEFQIFGDRHGNVVHLFERECSIQRRYQKIVEESPSPFVTPELRERMGAAAVRAAQALGYANAGTVEFIVDPRGDFYFLEVNTRLQVEHAVTELVVQHDLVQAQLRVAAGQPLPFRQTDLRQTGHALECRVYAEDPARGFLPSIGPLVRYLPPAAAHVRVDSSVREGYEVSVHYDPMLAKLIVWGRTRDEAVARLRWALRRFVVLGVTTNIEFLQNLIAHPAFRRGDLHTHFLEEHDIAPRRGGPPNVALVAGALLAKGTLDAPARDPMPAPAPPEAALVGPWTQAGRWRNV